MKDVFHQQYLIRVIENDTYNACCELGLRNAPDHAGCIR
jgi:hypothetical protein